MKSTPKNVSYQSLSSIPNARPNFPTLFFFNKKIVQYLKTAVVHPYLSRAFQLYEGCSRVYHGAGDLNLRNNTNKLPCSIDRCSSFVHVTCINIIKVQVLHISCLVYVLVILLGWDYDEACFVVVYIVIFVPKTVSFHANDKFYVTNNMC
jgi:hypothetical protein